MLRNCPDYYRETSLQDSIAETEEFIRHVRALQTKQVSIQSGYCEDTVGIM